MQTENTNYIYKNDFDKACFEYNIVAYGKYKDSTKRRESDKVLRDKAFEVASIQNMIDVKRISFNGLQFF